MTSSILVIVNVVDLGGVTLDEAERYPPIPGHGDCPIPSAVSRERM
jgi:hypothetical protein